MNHLFAPKTIALVANTAQSVVWNTADFYQYYGDGEINDAVSVRFRVTNNTGNVVYLSLNYVTRYDTVPFQERKNLAAVPAQTTVELSKATVPAIGALSSGIQTITITVIGASAGIVSIALVVADTDELASTGTVGDYIGADDPSVSAYTVIRNFGNVVTIADGFVHTIDSYTVPANKRFNLRVVHFIIDATPSFPDLIMMRFELIISGLSIPFNQYSLVDRFNTPIIFADFPTLAAGDQLNIYYQNTGVTNQTCSFMYMGKEIF